MIEGVGQTVLQISSKENQNIKIRERPLLRLYTVGHSIEPTGALISVRVNCLFSLHNLTYILLFFQFFH